MSSDEPTVRVYITKWALSAGILEADARLTNDGKYATNIGAGRNYFHVARRDYSLTAEEATARVLEMIKAKRKALAKAAKKLDALEEKAMTGKLPVQKWGEK